MLEEELAAKQLAALAHPVRLSIVRTLVSTGPAGLPAGQLGKPLDVAPNALSFHLQKLAHAGLVTSQRKGQFVIYQAAFPDLLALADTLVGACCSDSPEKCGSACPSSAAPDPGSN